MFSTVIELAGLACLVAGAFVLAGLGVALLVACPVLMFVGATTDDTAISRALGGAAARAIKAMRAAARALRSRVPRSKPKVA